MLVKGKKIYVKPREWGFATYLWHNQIRISAWHAGFVALGVVDANVAAVGAATAFDRIFYCGFSVFRFFARIT